MSPRRRVPTLWSYSSGERPNTVVVREKRPGGNLYIRMWNPVGLTQMEECLEHTDRQAAIDYADGEAKKLRDGAVLLSHASTVGNVLAHYLAYRTPRKTTPQQQQEDRRRAVMWTAYLGADLPVGKIGRKQWESFITDRSTGRIDARGAEHRPPRLPGPRAVDADLVFLQSVFNWACTWDVGPRKLLAKNPWGVPGVGVRNPLERPRNKAPARPYMTAERYRALRAAADDVLMVCLPDAPGARMVPTGEGIHPTKGYAIRGSRWMRPSYLGELMELAAQTGRRISALCRLTYADLVIGEIGKAKRPGITAIRWRPIKTEDETVVPVKPDTRAVLQRIVRARPGAGDRPLFPQGMRPWASINKDTAEDWLLAAEKAAGLAHIRGGGWHMARRAWATLHKRHPIVDVMRAGGWKDRRSLEQSYMISTEDDVMAVVNAPTVDGVAIQRRRTARGVR